MEQKKQIDTIVQIKKQIESMMEKEYNFEIINNTKVFCLSDNTYMSIFILSGEEVAFGMEYGEKNDFLVNDGDLYYPCDYDSIETLFEDMLAETKREYGT